MTEIPVAAVAAALAKRAELLADRPTPTHLSDESLVRQMLQAALPALLPAGPDLTAERWRQGGSHLNNVWAEAGTTGGKPGIPAGRMDSDELAARACADHNLALDLRWLFSKGYGVRMAPYADFDGVMLYEVVLSDDEGEQLLTGAAQPSLGAALAEARRQAEEATP